MPENIELIDEYFWLKYAKEHVSNAIQRVNEAASKLETFLGVVWGIYTTAFAVTLAFDSISDDLLIRLILALPVILLPIARYCCTWVQLPVYVLFKYNAPESIEEHCYGLTITTKNKRMQWAKAFSLVSVLSICLALAMFKIKGNDSYAITASIDGASGYTLITGKAEPAKDVTLYAIIDTVAGKPPVVVNTNVTADAKGNFIYPVCKEKCTIRNAFVHWPQNNHIKTLSLKL